MIDLDDVESYRKVDKRDMLGCIAELPEQCRDAWENVSAFEPPSGYADVQNVVVGGMGGSAIGGDLVRTLVKDACPVPIIVNRHYDLPAFVGEDTLLIASSYSGGTEETLSSFQQGLERGAKCLAITTGGRLAELAHSAGAPVLRFSYQSQPRAAVGHSFVLLVGLLEKLGFTTGKGEELENAIEHLKALQSDIGEKSRSTGNAAKLLAVSLYGRFAVVYGAEHLSQVARRWKTQLNENSKAWSEFEVLPELNHNAVVGYEHPEELQDKISVVTLFSPLYHPQVVGRLDVTNELLDQMGIAHHSIDARGESALAEILAAIHFGDYVSYYLAMLYEEDPTPVEAIAYLKERLAE